MEFAHRGGGNPGKRRRAASRADRARAMDSARARVDRDAWGGVTDSEVVALFALIHEDVYGVAEAELESGKVWSQATLAVWRFRTEQFGGDGAAVVDYLRWLGAREKGREAWRRDNGKSGARVSWRAAFSRALLTDYRIDRARGLT